MNYYFAINNAEFKKMYEEEMRVVEQRVCDFLFDKVPELDLEEREGQQNLMLDITGAIRDRTHMVAEAGVGIGKSYAYLIPVFYFIKHCKAPVIISTSTIALQEQLLRDIRRVAEMTGSYPDVLLAKGQSNFVCVKKAREILSSKGDAAAQDVLAQVETGTCDRSLFMPAVPSSIWKKICITNYSSRDCHRCRDHDKCQYYLLRGALRYARGIILCNHDLLTMHLRRQSMDQMAIMNGDARIIVVDEAHNLEEKVRNAFTVSYSKQEIIRIAEAARKTIRISGTGADKVLATLQDSTDNLYGLIQKSVEEDISENPKEMKFAERFYFRETEATKKQIETIHSAMDRLYEMADLYSDAGLPGQARGRDSDEAAIDAAGEVELFFRQAAAKDRETLFWVERTGRQVRLVSCPKDTAQDIQNLFFTDDLTTILTSATITNTVEGPLTQQYGSFIRSTGFPTDSQRGYLADPQPSPFPYDRNTMLYCCDDLPHPTREKSEFLDAATARLLQLLAISQGKALVLFTAKSDMIEVHERLKSDTSHGLTVFMQTEDAAQGKVLEQFRQEKQAVLLGTGTYWEGIDEKGPALSNVIIFKLPFPVPDPITDYKRKNTENGLMEVSVPEMVIRCKQGIGRLIRSFDDKGIAAILDPRIGEASTAPYKKILYEALPIKRRTSDLDELRCFYDSLYSDANRGSEQKGEK